MERGVVIPLGVDDNVFQAESAENAFLNKYSLLQQSPYLLTLCRLHPKKNLEVLIQTFLNLTAQPEFQAWKFVIAGDGEAEYVDRLKHSVQQHGGTDRVLFVGWLQGDEKLGALRGADLFALPSYQENFGLSVVEAMACGVPVFISEQVNLADEVTKAGAGWVVKLENGALYESLLEALRNKQARIERGNAARNLVRMRFTWPVVANELVGLYRELTKCISLQITYSGFRTNE